MLSHTLAVSPILLVSVVDNGDAAVLSDGIDVVDAGTPHALLSELMRTGAPLRDVLIRVVSTPDAHSLHQALIAVREFSAAGYPVDAIVVTRVPGAGDGWPKAWAVPQQARVSAFTAGSPVPVLTLRLRPQQRMVPRSMASTPCRQMPKPGVPAAQGDGYSWTIPIDGLAAVREVRIGQEGPELVLELDGHAVRRPLPPVLIRCIAIRADETPDGVVVAFERDPSLWPEGAS